MSAESGDDREEGEVGGRSATENVVTILVQGHSNEILLICGGFAMFPRQIHERCRGKGSNWCHNAFQLPLGVSR